MTDLSLKRALSKLLAETAADPDPEHGGSDLVLRLPHLGDRHSVVFALRELQREVNADDQSTAALMPFLAEQIIEKHGDEMWPNSIVLVEGAYSSRTRPRAESSFDNSRDRSVTTAVSEEPTKPSALVSDSHVKQAVLGAIALASGMGTLYHLLDDEGSLWVAAALVPVGLVSGWFLAQESTL